MTKQNWLVALLVGSSIGCFCDAHWSSAQSLSSLAAARGYAITDLGAPPGYANSWCWQQAINNSGLLAFYANNSDQDPNAFVGDVAFLWKNGQSTPLPGLTNATDTVAFSVNDNGQAVGRSTVTPPYNHAVLWNHGVINQLPELTGDIRSAALKINDRGQAVGYSRKSPNVRHAAVWYMGRVTQLPPLPNGGNFDEALGINEPGQIVGFSGPDPDAVHPALWSGGQVTDLGSLGGGFGDAYAINNKGQVVGESKPASGDKHPFFWQNGVMNDLGVAKGDGYGVAYGVNNLGQAVGYSSASSSSDLNASHALMWQNGVITVLQTAIPANSGWTLLQAGAINNLGQITGFGIHNGNYRGFLLTPTP
jgi:probable HAF family extracellular repeat protein